MIKNSLKNISKVISSGLTPLRSNLDYWIDGNIPWVKTEQLGVKYIYDSNEKITKTALENTSIKLNPANTLSIAMYGEGKTRGSVSILKNETTTNQACCNIVINDEKADFEFVYYNLKTQYKNLRNLSSGVRKNLNSNDIKNFEIYLPSFETQKQIAKVLSDLDSKIEINNNINQQLEAMAKTLYDYWFVQFDFPDANGQPYKSSGGKMVFNEGLKREIPDGWENKTIGGYCKSTGGYAFKSSMWSDEGSLVVKIKDIQENYTINLSDISHADLSGKEIDRKFIANPGDVLIAMTGATVGKYAIVPFTEKPLHINQRVGYFDLGDNPTNRLPFLINSLNQKYFRDQVFRVATGAAQPNISNDQINNIKLILPTKKILELYNSKMKSSYVKILNNQLENQKLSELRDWLLPMLMNGQVSVGSAAQGVAPLGMVAEKNANYNKQ